MQEGSQKPINILVLGHRGMLGSMCVKYFTRVKGYCVKTLSDTMRFNPDDPWPFIDACIMEDCEYIINAIGKIPVKCKDGTKLSDYVAINTLLPMMLCKYLTIQICYFPSTVGVFSGKPGHSRNNNSYTDAVDSYAISKALMEQGTLNNAVIIRSSFIDSDDNHNLLGSFLSLPKESQVTAAVNILYNPVTTLQWCKFVDQDIQGIVNLTSSKVHNYGTLISYSHSDLLYKFSQQFDRKDVEINPYKSAITTYHDLGISHDDESLYAPSLDYQLQDLKRFVKTLIN